MATHAFPVRLPLGDGPSSTLECRRGPAHGSCKKRRENRWVTCSWGTGGPAILGVVSTLTARYTPVNGGPRNESVASTPTASSTQAKAGRRRGSVASTPTASSMEAKAGRRRGSAGSTSTASSMQAKAGPGTNRQLRGSSHRGWGSGDPADSALVGRPRRDASRPPELR